MTMAVVFQKKTCQLCIFFSGHWITNKKSNQQKADSKVIKKSDKQTPR